MTPPRRRVPLTDERVSAALRSMADYNGVSHEGLAHASGLERSAITRMLNGKSLTMENIDRLLPALGFDWPDLVQAVQGDFAPARLRQDLEEAIHHIADLRRKRHGR